MRTLVRLLLETVVVVSRVVGGRRGAVAVPAGGARGVCGHVWVVLGHLAQPGPDVQRRGRGRRRPAARHERRRTAPDHAARGRCHGQGRELAVAEGAS
uniref:Putative secreted protein n=1 Tax=Ixodes ricinus TaxID=34613 RepID=A0A6B0U4U7_IXORI